MPRNPHSARQLGVTAAVRRWHDYRQDTAFDGRYLRRLPDRTLVPAEEYEERLREYEAQLQRAAVADEGP